MTIDKPSYADLEAKIRQQHGLLHDWLKLLREEPTNYRMLCQLERDTAEAVGELDPAEDTNETPP